MTTDAVPDEAILRRQVDRRQLHEIIAGLDEGVLLVEPGVGIVWANERALALHRVADLTGLGGSAVGYRERFELAYRNNHPLTEAQYPLDRLAAEERFEGVVTEIRRRPAEPDGWRAFLQWRGFTLSDAKGEAESGVLVIQDVTDRFTAEERFERTFSANPAPAVICRLSDLRYIKVNHGFLDLTGFSREDVIGRSTYELDILAEASNKERAIEGLRQGKTIPQMEARLPLADGGVKAVIVAGQPLEVGEEPCMLFTFMDMEPRRRAEDAMRQSEERFARSFRMTPVPTLLSTREGRRVLEVNDAFVSAFGYAREELTADGGAEPAIWISAAARRELERQIASHGSVRNAEAQLRTREGEALDCLVSAETVTIQGQDCVLTVIQDITERKRSEVELIAAIEAVMQDTSWFSRTVIEKLANLRQTGAGRAAPASAGLSDLTPREMEVLGLMCQGLGDAEIVKALGLSRNTVRNHVARIYVKAGVHSRTKAVVWARERGFTGLPAGKAKLPPRPTRG